jgi:predicted RND superfamily exporter protein
VKRLHDVFARWAALMWDWHRAVGAGCIALIVICPILMRGLQFETLSGSPLNDDAAENRYHSAVKRFGEGSPLVIALTRSNITARAFDAFTEALVEEVRSWEDIGAVDYRPYAPETPEAAAWQLSVGLANAGTNTIALLAERLTPAGIQHQLDITRARLVAARGVAQQAQIAADPMDIQSLVMPFYTSRVTPDTFALSSYIDSADGLSRLVLIRPVNPAEDAPYAIGLLERMVDTIETLRPAYGADDVRVGFTGKYALAADGTALLQREIGWITLGAVLGLCLLFTLVFRNLRATLLCAFPVMVSMLAVLVVVCLVFNPVGLIAMGFAAIILGLSIDVTIHCVGNLFQKLGQADSVREATIDTVRECGPPILIGVTTTAAAFLCMVFAKFSGLREFGLLASSGLLVSLAVTLTVFPAAVRWLYGRRQAAASPICIPLAPRHLFAIAYAFPRRSLVLAGAIAIISMAIASGFRFDMQPDSSVPTALPAVKTATEVSERHGTAFLMSARVTIEAPTLSKAMHAQRTLDDFLVDGVSNGTIAGFESASMLLHYPQGCATADSVPPDHASEKLLTLLSTCPWHTGETPVPRWPLDEALVASVSLSWHGRLARMPRASSGAETRTFQGSVDAIRSLKAGVADVALDLAASLTTGTNPPSPSLVAYCGLLEDAIADLNVESRWPPEHVVDRLRLGRYAIVDTESVHLQTYIWPPGGAEGMTAVKQIADSVQGVTFPEETSLSTSSTYEAYEALNEIIRNDFLRVSIIGIAVVACITFLYFRSALSVLLALTPMIAAIPFTFALLHLTQRPFSPSGIGLIAMLIGIGIDDAVHILTRVHEHKEENIPDILRQIGPVLTLTSVSTMIGFGVLLTSQFTALSSLGFAIVIGVAASLVFTVVVIPACLGMRNAGRRG